MKKHCDPQVSVVREFVVNAASIARGMNVGQRAYGAKEISSFLPSNQ